MAQAYIFKSLTANVTPATLTLNGEFTIDTVEITNDSNTVDLHVQLTGLNSTSSDYIKIMPQEKLKVSSTNVTSLSYKTLSGSASFRVMALNNNN